MRGRRVQGAAGKCGDGESLGSGIGAVREGWLEGDKERS